MIQIQENRETELQFQLHFFCSSVHICFCLKNVPENPCEFNLKAHGLNVQFISLCTCPNQHLGEFVCFEGQDRRERAQWITRSTRTRGMNQHLITFLICSVTDVNKYRKYVMLIDVLI